MSAAAGISSSHFGRWESSLPASPQNSRKNSLTPIASLQRRLSHRHTAVFSTWTYQEFPELLLYYFTGKRPLDAWP
eukprot:1159327-Pelagomonas_calceolata.AAC.7